ncbi:hypothetical protein FIBSPDRAFT_885725 [Athelia psychrophila]|uniref:F-box domain-containing protein n=1 Tax=Athelia psychrophila TaxID=1759441 RepID=A0A166RNY1_9AGAM|nr:hypothetical protein FIBSPDRAFT_885725 [Fibularhizoctonia sp. CBS 109695]
MKDEVEERFRTPMVWGGLNEQQRSTITMFAYLIDQECARRLRKLKTQPHFVSRAHDGGMRGVDLGCAPLTSVFTALTAIGIHRATFPHAQTLRRLVSSFPVLERLALSDISVAPCLCNAYQPSERAAAMTVPKGLRSLTLDMGDATTGKGSQAEELLEWLANGDGCAKLATLDVRGIKRASFPAARFLPFGPPCPRTPTPRVLEDVVADDLEASPIHLQMSLKTLHITAPSLASSILLLPALPLFPVLRRRLGGHLAMVIARQL